MRKMGARKGCGHLMWPWHLRSGKMPNWCKEKRPLSRPLSEASSTLYEENVHFGTHLEVSRGA